MIAYLEHFVHENDSEPLLNHSDDAQNQIMDLEGTIDYCSTAFAGKDFGGLHATTPSAVVRLPAAATSPPSSDSRRSRRT
ncbi:hypothetical protein OSB04_014706 [Centaurea solstitialis]|uniref:Uncharacterized protein n=1 Tax=Centaurea solstitialis TaxID=347529 RepID=A0AA38T8T4_9ASTR|nr:hypothetical protein OSB04_014706 [Centaurea solstitialis]